MPQTDPRGCILVVDDDPGQRAAVRFLLESAGYEVATASHGADALAQLRGGLRPALILLDLAMPVMDGAQFRAIQSADPQLAGIPVIILSAQEENLIRVPANGYIHKGANADRLLAVIARFFPGYEH